MSYLAKQIVPRIKRAVDMNKESFGVIFALGDACEPITADTIKTFARFNQGRICREGKVHIDNTGTKRFHTCTICWEVLWVYATHKVVNCPLLRAEFWKKINAAKIK